VQISDWLDKAQLRLAERGAIGSDLKTVTTQRDGFQVIQSSVVLMPVRTSVIESCRLMIHRAS
jgi:hypothetical protein